MEKQMEKQIEKILEWAYREWRKGNLYIENDNFYVMGTGEYVCPTL
jgi:hypothetical protein